MSDNIIDSRDLEKEIDELEEELDAADDAYKEEGEAPGYEDERDRLLELKQLREQVSEWYEGATLINEDHFEEYARQVAEDIGAVEDASRWPCDCIDWERAARELQMDYTAVELDGDTYYVR